MTAARVVPRNDATAARPFRGSGMTVASDADRAKAAELLSLPPFRHARLDAIAAALAAERAAAVEQITTDVRALAEEMDADSAAADDLAKNWTRLPDGQGRLRVAALARREIAARLLAVVADAGKPDTSSEEETA